MHGYEFNYHKYSDTTIDETKKQQSCAAFGSFSINLFFFYWIKNKKKSML